MAKIMENEKAAEALTLHRPRPVAIPTINAPDLQKEAASAKREDRAPHRSFRRTPGRTRFSCFDSNFTGHHRHCEFLDVRPRSRGAFRPSGTCAQSRTTRGET